MKINNEKSFPITFSLKQGTYSSPSISEQLNYSIDHFYNVQYLGLTL